jgi:hypothetical protein
MLTIERSFSSALEHGDLDCFENLRGAGTIKLVTHLLAAVNVAI